MRDGGEHIGDGFRGEQRRVLVGAACAAAVSALVILLLLAVRPFGVPDLPDAAARVAFALRADLFVVAWLGVMVGAVAQRRFFSAEDIGGSASGGGGAGIKRANAVLQNTLEQVVLAVASHAGLASVLPGRFLVVVPGLVALFCVGRLLFWLGYRGGAGSRAFGFGLTFYPSMGALVAAVGLVVFG
jgi:hypothetical protein